MSPARPPLPPAAPGPAHGAEAVGVDAEAQEALRARARVLLEAPQIVRHGDAGLALRRERAPVAVHQRPLRPAATAAAAAAAREVQQPPRRRRPRRILGHPTTSSVRSLVQKKLFCW